MSDGMIYLCFLISWLALMLAMRLANNATVKEAEQASFDEGYAAGAAAERQYIANLNAQWRD